jgi:hypothetical protein
MLARAGQGQPSEPGTIATAALHESEPEVEDEEDDLDLGNVADPQSVISSRPST